MNNTIAHGIVSVLAIALAFSALYVFSERDEITDVFYGSTYRISVPPNSNATIFLGRVSDNQEWTPSFTVQLGSPYLRWNQSTSIPQPSEYSFEASLFVSVQVNKSAFVLLEDYMVFEQLANRTVDFKAFLSSGGDYPGGSPFEYNMELRHIYQLKIGNYETSITNWNQSGPHELIIANTNRTLQAIVGAPDSSPLGFPSQGSSPDPWGPPSYRITVTFTKEPNMYLVSGLGILDVGLIVTYVFSIRKRDSKVKAA
jgi:hypothetical protein